MICTRCGTDNDDRALHCECCRRKLQSSFNFREDEPNLADTQFVKMPLLPRLEFKFNRPERKGYFAKHIEAWFYAIIVLAAVFVFSDRNMTWPFYVMAPALAGLIWIRRL